MGKLKTVKPQLASMPSRIGLGSTGETLSRSRDARIHWRKWYKTSRWQKLRWLILVRDNFTCKFCGEVKADTSQLVCDHIERHHGNEQIFWDGPFQTLCATCHGSTKQKQENQL